MACRGKTTVVMRLAIIAALLFSCSQFLSASAAGSKVVNVSLRANWKGTSLLLEACNFFAKDGKAHQLWQFLDRWQALEPLPESVSDKDCVNRILSVGGSLVGSNLLGLLHLSLSLRTMSPRVVLYRQLAKQSANASGAEVPSQNTRSTPVADRWHLSSDPVGPGGACTWVRAGAMTFTLPDEASAWLAQLAQRANETGEEEEEEEQVEEVYEFDYVYPGSNSLRKVAILYGAPGSPGFRELHLALATAAQQGLITYVFRPVLATGCEAAAHKCTRLGTEGNVNLGGFGVELALKNMEYKAIDDSKLKSEEGAAAKEEEEEDLARDVKGFIFSKLLERKPELAAELMTFRDQLLSTQEISDQINVWELKDLGFQAAQRIVQSGEPLKLMQDINQNFPSLVTSLSRMKLNKTIQAEIQGLQKQMPPGRTIVAINSRILDLETLDLFSLLDKVKAELGAADELSKLHIPPHGVLDLLKVAPSPDDAVMRLDFRSDDHVFYFNDIEKDPMYSTWRSNLQELLMPVYPGQMRYVRKNLYHAVYVIDPVSYSGLKAVEMINYYWENLVPAKFGIILVSPAALRAIQSDGPDADVSKSVSLGEDLSSLVIRMFEHLVDELGAKAAFGLLLKLHMKLGGKEVDPGTEVPAVTLQQVEDAFVNALMGQKGRVSRSRADDVLKGLKDGSLQDGAEIEKSNFVRRLGLAHHYPCLLMNGIYIPGARMISGTLGAIHDETQALQQAVYFQKIVSRTDVLAHFLSAGGAARYNPQVLAADGTQLQYVSLTSAVSDPSSPVAALQYLHTPGTEDELKAITHWLAVDLSSSDGVDFLLQALRYLVSEGERARIAVLHNVNATLGDEEDLNQKTLLPRIIHAITSTPSRRSKLVPFLQTFLNSDVARAAARPKGSPEHSLAVIQETERQVAAAGLKGGGLQDAVVGAPGAAAGVAALEKVRKWLADVAEVPAGTNAVITNGRVLIPSGGSFEAEDFKLLDDFEWKRTKPVPDIVEKVTAWPHIEDPDDLNSDFLSNVIMAASSAIAAREKSADVAHFDMLKTTHSAIERSPPGAMIQVDAIVDPLSASAQAISPLLLLLNDWLQPRIRIIMNPLATMGEVPLKNFYRFAHPPKDMFSSTGALSGGASVTFSNLPQTRTLTMNLKVPEAWLVESVIAKYDLDNLVLDKVPERTVQAVYELEALMLTGHCSEEASEPPRGLQLVLGTPARPHMEDTLVMANLGYFQLKAAPGVWQLKLAEGRSRQLYTLSGPGQGTDGGPVSRQVAISDLRGSLVQLEVVKKEGMEEETILEATSGEEEFDDEEEEEWGGEGDLKRKSHSMWGSVLKAFNKAAPAPTQETALPDTSNETVNIFSIASGHLYERFTRIMILSTLKHTRRPLKFWFIKNYLSPKFKDIIPHMAREYGFEYDLVTYKWPSWLHKQTEKQRLIWAYKILFLDVLFPLSTKKVIFADADQIIRTDMGQLYDLDLKNRPLAYTPMCDNNPDMEGYRFWKQGFWKDHLRGRPYHISALYVVDLVKFRQLAAGDHLRVFYESLSKDPNSLANLDQDLPNYAQHSVPIFSLPQHWLWCESWCGNATKGDAKTIDLCNNPMTKEPKLEGARRIVAEWPALDEEQRKFSERVESGEFDDLPAVAAREGDSDVLTMPPDSAAPGVGDGEILTERRDAVDSPEEVAEQLELDKDGLMAEIEDEDLASKAEL